MKDALSGYVPTSSTPPLSTLTAFSLSLPFPPSAQLPLPALLPQSLHKLLAGDDDDDEEVDFWAVIKDYTERVFLVPTVPSGILAVVGLCVCVCTHVCVLYLCLHACICMFVTTCVIFLQEFQLPAFSSRLMLRPPRGDKNYLDIRLNYPFLCMSVDSVLQVRTATELSCRQVDLMDKRSRPRLLTTPGYSCFTDRTTDCISIVYLPHAYIHYTGEEGGRRVKGREEEGEGERGGGRGGG